MKALHIIPDGNFEVKYSPGRQNMSPVSFDANSPSIKLGSNCLLIRNKGKNILIDAGTGHFNPDENKYKMDYPRQLLKGIKDSGLEPSDIDIVILTHFHFDHCGGCVNENKQPVFPNAMHYIQSSEVEFAKKDAILSEYWIIFENILEQNDQIRLIDGNCSIDDSCDLILAPGHTIGFQYVKISLNDQNYVFPGDIIPTLWHLNNDNIIYLDYDLNALRTAKEEIIEDCIANDTTMIFQHTVRPTMGKLLKKGKRIGFKRIFI